MPITQIPFQDPVVEPEKPQPEQLALYDIRDWDRMDGDAGVHEPHLLIQLQDDLERSRKREAAWISVIVHLVLAILLWNADFIGRYMPWHRVQVVAIDPNKDKNVTFLTLPPDLQKPTRKPNTNVLSDKDRIAMSRHPELDPKELRKSLASPPPGAPGKNSPRAAQPAPSQPMAQNQPQVRQPQQGQPTQRPQFDTNQTAQLQAPPRPNNSFAKYAAGMTPGQAIQQAAQGAAANRAGGGQEGDFGLGKGAHGRQLGNLEVLSDTQGVDFGPYLQRILQDVKENWYHLIPESAEMKKGKLAIEFAIMKDGHVQGLRVVVPSGDVALDRPAYGAITASDPFPPLPSEFNGQYLSLRFRFYYNPDKADLE